MVRLDLSRVKLKSKKILGISYKTINRIYKVCFYFIFSLFFLLLISITVVLYSHNATGMVWNLLKSSDIGLEGDLKGRFIDGISIDNFALRIPDVITIESEKVILEYNLHSLFKLNLNFSKIEATNFLLIIGNKPENFPLIGNFLSERLYEVRSFVLKNDKAKSLTRVYSKKEDSTYYIAPDNPIITDDVGDMVKQDIPYGSDLFPMVDVPISINIENIVVNNFLMISDAVDVAIAEFYSSAQYRKKTIYLGATKAKFIDVLLHNERFVEDELKTPTYTENSNNLLENKLSKSKDTKNVKDAKNKKTTPNKFVFPSNLEKALEQKTTIDICNHDCFANKISIMPAVVLPFKVVVDDFVAENVLYHQDGYSTGVGILSLSGIYEKSLIKVKYINIIHELGSAQLKDAYIDLINHYSMQGYLYAQSDNEQDYFSLLANHKLEAFIDGDLALLSGKIKILGTENLMVDASLSPLDSVLPFKVEIHSEGLQWPLSRSQYTIGKFNLKAKGNLDGFLAKLELNNISFSISDEKLHVDSLVATNFKKLKIYKLDVTNKNKDEVKLVGHADISGTFGFDGIISGKIKDLSSYVPNVNGHLEFEIEPDFYYQNLDNWKLKTRKLYSKGQIFNQNLLLNNSSLNVLVKKGKYYGNIDDLLLTFGENKLYLKGSFDDNVNIFSKIGIKDFSNFNIAGLIGDANIDLEVNGSIKSPLINLSLSSKNFIFNNHKLKDIQLKGDISTDNYVLTSSKVNLSLREYKIDKYIILRKLSIFITGSEAYHKLLLATKLLDGDLSLTEEGQLNNNRSSYNFNFKDFNLNVKKIITKLESPMMGTLDLKSKIVLNTKTIIFNLNNNKLIIKPIFFDSLTKNGTIKFEAKNFDVMRYKSLLPNNFSMKNSVDIEVDMSFEKGTPIGFINLKSDENHIVYNKNRIDFNEFKTTANFYKDSKVDLITLLDFGKNGNISSKVIVEDPLNKKLLNGNLKVDNVDLNMFAKISPDISHAIGVINAELEYKGSITEPLLFGYIKINDSSIYPIMDIGYVTAINTIMNFKGSTADINSSMFLREKKATIIGSVSWLPEIVANLTIDTEELPINLLGYGNGIIKLSLNGEYRDNTATVKGDINFPFADIRVKELPESSISSSSDVIEISKDEEGNYVVKKNTNLNISLRINLKIGPDVTVRALGLKTKLKGDLSISQRPKKALTMRGNIDLENGRVHAYGQNLIIEEGKITFNGDVANPNINIRAIRDPHSMENESIKAGVVISGSVSSPQINVFTQPVMSQSESLSYLLRGKGLDQSAASSQSMSSQLLIGIGLMQTSNVISKIGETFGFEDVTLDSKGSGDDTAVEVSAYILPKVQVAYGYGIYNALSEFRVRYEMFPRFYIEGISALEQSIDAIYKFEF
ncbi:MAG: translocation/assembly module TamB domain-containing protein [Succinivibrionaceae bacterium]